MSLQLPAWRGPTSAVCSSMAGSPACCPRSPALLWWQHLATANLWGAHHSIFGFSALPPSGRVMKFPVEILVSVDRYNLRESKGPNSSYVLSTTLRTLRALFHFIFQIASSVRVYCYFILQRRNLRLNLRSPRLRARSIKNRVDIQTSWVCFQGLNF